MISSGGLVYGFSGDRGSKWPKGIFFIEVSAKDGGCTFLHQQYYEPSNLDRIITEFIYTDVLPTLYVEKFWEARQIIRSYKDNTKGTFFPSWVNFIDESMSICSNIWT